MKAVGLSAYLAVAVLALSGCQQKGTAAAPQAAATAAAAPATPAAPLSEVFPKAGEEAVSVDLSGLPEDAASFLCSVDSINETPASESPTLSRGEAARFSGYVQATSIDQPAILVLRSDAQNYAVRNTPTAERPDIAAAKQMTGTSAFDYSTMANLGNVVPGVYSIEILGKSGDAYQRCGSSILVTVE